MKATHIAIAAFIATLAGGSAVVPLVAAEESMIGGDVITVEAGPIGAATTLGGTVIPLKEVSFSAQLPGRVEFVSGIEGDWFKAGTVLVALDDDSLLAKRQAAYAALSNAQAAFRNSRVQYTRQVYAGSDSADAMGMGMPKMMDEYITRPMQEMGGDTGVMQRTNPELVRRAQIYAQGTQIDQARAGLLQVQAQIQELETMLRDTKSVAPFDGVIVRKSVEVGDTVQPGMPLMAFADTRNLQIKVDVPARLMPGIQTGMTIPAKLDVGDTKIEAKVSQIYPMADPQRHTVTVKLELPKDAPGGPGMYAEVMIPDVTTPVKNLPTIPKSAVVWRGSLPAVYVVGSGTEPELRMIRLGGSVDQQSVSVLSGLQAGERIMGSPPRGNSEWNSPDQSGSGGGK